MIQAVAPPDLPERWTGKIHSIFANSCNVLLDSGELLTIQAGGQGDSRFVRGLDEGGKPRFESALFFGEVLS